MTDRHVELPLARCWWLKRLAIASVMVLVALVGAWFAVDGYFAAKMRARLEAYRAEGQATSIEEIAPPAIDDDQNAALLYKQAAAAMVAGVDSPRQSSMEYDDEMPPVPQWMEMTKKAVEANKDAISIARHAMGHKAGNWQTVYKSPLINVLLPSLASQRALANVLADAAVYQHTMGNEFEAIAHIRNLLHHSDILRAEPNVVANLLGMGIEALALHALGQFAGEVRVSDGSTESAGADRRDVESLIADLLRRRPETSVLRALQTERLWADDMMSTSFGRSIVARPLHRADVLRVWSHVDALQEAIGKADMPSGQTKLKPRSALDDAATGAWLGLGMGAKVDPIVQLHALRMSSPAEWLHVIIRQMQWARRAVATKLAARLFFVDHGAYPAKLEEFVPAYLPAVPADPFTADGRPMGYVLAEQGTRPIIYSVGEDGVDDTARGKAKIPRRYLVGSQSTDGGTPDDQYRDLATWVSGEPRKWIGQWDNSGGSGLGVESTDENAGETNTPGDEDQCKERGQ